MISTTLKACFSYILKVTSLIQRYQEHTYPYVESNSAASDAGRTKAASRSIIILSVTMTCHPSVHLLLRKQFPHHGCLVWHGMFQDLINADHAKDSDGNQACADEGQSEHLRWCG
jgi:hypothetical protein